MDMEAFSNSPEDPKELGSKKQGFSDHPSSKMMAATHSPSCSETSSSLFSTVDCSSSFSSRSDASSFAKSDDAAVRSSVEFPSSSSKLDAASTADSGGSTIGETEYFEFSFRKSRIRLQNAGSTKDATPASTTEDDDYERYPVWTRYCPADDVHSCINPCFEKDDNPEPRVATMSKKLAKSLSSVLSKRLTLSPTPGFRRASCERFTSRLGLEHPSPSGNYATTTPGRTFNTSKKQNVYKASPTRKSLGCLGGSKLVHDDGTHLYVASEESVHGGKNRCLPSPRLSFGSGRIFRHDAVEISSSGAAMVVPSSRVQGQLHCILRGELPSFTFLVDGLEEVFVAKAVKPSSPSGLETGDLLYSFYSWRPKGRAKGSWKSWMRKDRVPPDFIGRMTVNSRAISSDGGAELEFVLRDDTGSVSPRLSFSTWETSSTHTAGRSPMYGGFGSPLCPMTPSPCRMASSRYVASVSPPVRLHRRSRRIPCSPLRPRSDDDRSSDTWSDTEVECAETTTTGKESHELGAFIITGDATLGCLNQKWERARKSSVVRKASSYYYRRMGLPGGLAGSLEAKENDNRLDVAAEANSSSGVSRTRSLKLRELMGVGEDFGKTKGACSVLTAILPAGSHGIPLHGSAGPEPLVDRWRSGGRCDCGSWDLGCGLTILTGQIPLAEDEESIEIVSRQGANGEKQVVMSLTTVEEGFFSFSFQAPMTYLQAFASAVASLYTRGPASRPPAAPCSNKVPRFPLRPLVSSAAAADALSYCSPPSASLLDRL